MNTTEALKPPAGTAHGRLRWYVRLADRQLQLGENTHHSKLWEAFPYTDRDDNGRPLYFTGPTFFASRAAALSNARHQARKTYGSSR